MGREAILPAWRVQWTWNRSTIDPRVIAVSIWQPLAWSTAILGVPAAIYGLHRLALVSRARPSLLSEQEAEGRQGGEAGVE